MSNGSFGTFWFKTHRLFLHQNMIFFNRVSCGNKFLSLFQKSVNLHGCLRNNEVSLGPVLFRSLGGWREEEELFEEMQISNF